MTDPRMARIGDWARQVSGACEGDFVGLRAGGSRARTRYRYARSRPFRDIARPRRSPAPSGSSHRGLEPPRCPSHTSPGLVGRSPYDGRILVSSRASVRHHTRLRAPKATGRSPQPPRPVERPAPRFRRTWRCAAASRILAPGPTAIGRHPGSQGVRAGCPRHRALGEVIRSGAASPKPMFPDWSWSP